MQGHSMNAWVKQLKTLKQTMGTDRYAMDYCQELEGIIDRMEQQMAADIEKSNEVIPEARARGGDWIPAGGTNELI